jgi:hypothetical protein
MTIGIYKIFHLPSDSIYIGQSIDIDSRWHRHISELKSNEHHNIGLQYLWNTSKFEDFFFEIIENCPEEIKPVEQQNWLLNKEIYYVCNFKKEEKFKVLNDAIPSLVTTLASKEELDKKIDDLLENDQNLNEASIEMLNHSINRLYENLKEIEAFLSKRRDKFDEMRKALVTYEISYGAYKIHPPKRSFIKRLMFFRESTVDREHYVRHIQKIKQEIEINFPELMSKIELKKIQKEAILNKIKHLSRKRNSSLYQNSSINRSKN